MAAPTPTFKLVLVGDGGTGKVSPHPIFRERGRHHHQTPSALQYTSLCCGVVLVGTRLLAGTCCANIMMPSPDHLRQAPLDW